MTEDERRIGRPRDDSYTPALLEAARRLVLRNGYNRVSISSISEAAGVSKQALYRRWVGKADLVMDAFFASASDGENFGELPFAEALLAFLTRLFANLEVDGPAIRCLIASAQADEVFLSEFKERFVRPRAQVVEKLIQTAMARDEINGDADVAIATEALHGAFWYRLLQGESLDEAFAARLSKFVVSGLSPR